MLDARPRVGHGMHLAFGGALVILTNRFARTLVLSALASTLLALWLMLISALRAESALPPNPIQVAIDAASDGGTVVIPTGTYTESLTIDKNMTLTGAVSSTTIIRAVSGQRVITVTAGYNLRIENLTVTVGQAILSVNGGGIYVENGNLTVVNSQISNNSAQYGGGIYEGSFYFDPNKVLKRVDVIGSILELNFASGQGGAVYASGNAALTNTQVLSNTANLHGGGIMILGGRGDLVGGIFRHNTAGQDGGGVNINNSISVTGTQFISNTAGQNGGGLHQWNMSPSVSILSARFERNTSALTGGGMRANGATTISGTLFLSDTVNGTTNDVYGGGAHIGNALQVSASTFTGNVASCTGCGYYYGGGLSIEGSSAPAVIEDSLFENGSAWMGVGIYRNPNRGGSVTVRRSTFRDNSGGYGAGIHTPDAQIENSSFLRNFARDRGGALQANTAVLTATRFISNTTGTSGSGAGAAILVRMDGTNLLFAENQGASDSAIADLWYWGTGATAGNLSHVTIARPLMSTSPSIAVPVGTLNIRNSILVSSTVGISVTGNAVVDVDYTLFFGGTPIQSSGGTVITGTHILTGQNPQFVNPAAGDYHLMSSSPAIDYGADLGITTDLDGHTRPVDADPDLGAYEYQPVVPP